MTDDAVLMLVWSHKGETMVIPMVDSNGDGNLLMTMLVEKLPERVKATAEAAVLRGTVADLRGELTKLRLVAREAGELAERYRELERERDYMNALQHIVPVEAP